MIKETISERIGCIKKNKYGWDICDDDFWGTGYSSDINGAYLYSENGIPAKETITKISFDDHIIHTYITKSGKFGAKCDNCKCTHAGKPKKEPSTAYESLMKKDCAYTIRTITILENAK